MKRRPINPARFLFALFLAAFFGVIVFYKFHALFYSAAGGAHYVIERVSQTAISHDYNAAIARVNNAEDDETPPKLPDISGFTVEKIAAMAPSFHQGKIEIRDMKGLPRLAKFGEGPSVPTVRLAQMEIMPQAIVIDDGDYDFAHLYQAIKSATAEPLIEKQGDGVYLLRLPILVGENASLTIGSDVKQLRLSQEKGAFLVAGGRLFIIKTNLTGWNEKKKEPTYYQDRTIFRPFIVSWAGAQTYIAGSRIEHMGYRKDKSYGLSYSSCTKCRKANITNLAPATGAIVGNFITDMYYGFYCYEAEDIAIVGNTFANNVIYGVDPHDRSKHLIIAKNNSYGAEHKHGIIISREVNDSWIFDNYAHDNNGSGIMIDRKSVRNVLANNISTHNGQDGITFFESPDNLTYHNQITKNGLNGIRGRNSWGIKMVGDEILDNASTPVSLYTSRLEGTQKNRNFKLDPYVLKAGGEVIDAVIKGVEGKPMVKIIDADSVTLANVKELSGGAVFSDQIFTDESDIINNMSQPGQAVIVSKKSLMTKFLQDLK